MKRVLAALAAAACCAVLLCGCTVPILGIELAPETGSDEDAGTMLEPTVSSPDIITDGVLTVGLDYSYAPFAGESGGQVVGIDADVAAALAEELGLTVEFVDIGTDGGPSAVASGTCDIFMNFDQTTAATASCSYAGSYLEDAPALFAISADGSSVAVATASLSSSAIAAQTGSVSASLVSKMFGATALSEKTSLVEAFEALETGAADYAAAGSVVGRYIAHSNYSDIAYAACLENASEIGIGVASTNYNLQNAVSTALSTISYNGVLDLVLEKWLGEPVDLSSPLQATVAASPTPSAVVGDAITDETFADGTESEDDGSDESYDESYDEGEEYDDGSEESEE